MKNRRFPFLGYTGSLLMVIASVMLIMSLFPAGAPRDVQQAVITYGTIVIFALVGIGDLLIAILEVMLREK